MRIRAIGFASVLLGAFACVAPQSGAQHSGGVLVIAGGAVDSRSQVLPRFVAETRSAAVRRGQTRAVLEVVPTASGDPAGSLAHNRGIFESIATEVTVQGLELSVDDAELAAAPETWERLSQACGIWFTGGNQSRITSLFRPTDPKHAPLFFAARDTLLEGGVIGGSSAGAAIMSETMIAGGRSEDALLHGDGEGGVKIDEGLGFFRFGIVDQHFLARGRLGRLLVALEAVGDRYGFGIEENSSLVVYLGESAYALAVGMRGVCIIDRGTLADREFELTLLGTDDRWDFEEGTASPRAGRISMPEGLLLEAPSSLDALWASGAIEQALMRLARNPEQAQQLLSEHFQLELRSGPKTVFRVAPGNASDLFATRVECRLAARR